MARTNCIYCPNPLDNSDEHIIPDSMRGRLHSTNIICSACNNNFGRHIDPVFKELLNPLLIAFGFENANHTYAEGLDDVKYNISRKGVASPIKTEVTTKSIGGKLYLNVSGGAKSAMKAFKHQVEKLTKSGHKFVGYTLEQNVAEHNHFKLKTEIKITPKLIIALNKIATEYFAYCNLNVDNIKELLKRVKDLDESLNNVTFCNWKCDIREYESYEVTHLLMLRTNKNRTLYCYIELFNCICVCIPLSENYPEEVSFIYYQNALTGEKLNKAIDFNYELEFNNNQNGDFEPLVNAVLYRLSDINFKKMYEEGMAKIAETYKAEKEQGTIPSDDKGMTLVKRLTAYAGKLSVDFPYMITDYKDEMDDDVNRKHSNMREEQYEEFCEKNKVFIGKDIKINEDLFKFDSFKKIPLFERNNILLIKVYCCLINQETGKQKHFPYSVFFQMITDKYPESRLKRTEEKLETNE
jgi:hypothetical protein